MFPPTVTVLYQFRFPFLGYFYGVRVTVHSATCALYLVCGSTVLNCHCWYALHGHVLQIWCPPSLILSCLCILMGNLKHSSWYTALLLQTFLAGDFGFFCVCFLYDCYSHICMMEHILNIPSDAREGVLKRPLNACFHPLHVLHSFPCSHPNGHYGTASQNIILIKPISGIIILE